MQIETETGLSNLSDILSVPGIDAIFFGPVDIAASFGSLGKSTDEAIQVAVIRALSRRPRPACRSGVFAGDQAFLRRCERAGARLLGVTSDAGILIAGGKQVLAGFKG